MGSHPKLSIWGCFHSREGRTSIRGEPEDDLSFHCPVYCFPAPPMGYTYLATWLEEPCLPQAYSCTLHTSSISATTRCKRNNKSIQGMQHMFYKGYFTLEVSTSSHHVVTLLLIWDVSSVSSLSVNSGQAIHRPIMFGILNPSLPFTFPLE